MKSTWKNMLSVLGVTVCTALFTGCEVDAADETKPGSAQETNSKASTPPEPKATPPLAVANEAPASAALPPLTAPEVASATNAPAGTNVVVNPIPPTMPTNLNLSVGVQEIVKLANSGVSETVILLYIEKATTPFNLDAADIVYLNDLGISSEVLTAMLNHDGAGPEMHAAITNKTDVAEAPAAPAAPVSSIANLSAAPAQPAPAQPQYEVSSNYVAAAPVQGVPDPNAPAQQPPVVVQQQPVIVQQPVVVAEPAVAYSYFYSSLAPYGGWVYVGDYGWCWRPTVAVVHSGWRPYAHGGRWLYSDAGWYWHSDYSWGWAPFHYGRWHCSSRFGWVWTPDYTWGPSWVTWRRGVDYCGWAPLPPRCDVRPGIGFSYWDRNVGFGFSFGLGYEHYTFVPTRHFAGRRVIDHVVPTDRTVNIYKDTTIVNNYIVGNNNTIINNGIGRDYVAAHTRSEIPRVSVREEPRGNGNRVIPDRVQKSGNEMVVYRPTPPPARAEAALRETRERIRPSSAGPSVTSGFAAGEARPGTLQPRSIGEASRAPASGTISPRGEATRPGMARSEVPVAAYAKPAPLRPEPERSVSTGLRPASPNMTVTPSNPISRPGTFTPSARPSIGAVENRSPGIAQPSASLPQTARPAANVPARSEIGRSSNFGATPNTGSPNIAQPAQPAVSQRPAYPARSPDLVAPRNEARNEVVAPTPGVNSVPRLTPQPNVSPAPQPIQNSGISPAIPSAAPRISTPPAYRSESFGSSRPTAAPVPQAPSGGISQPQRVAPSTPNVSPAPSVRSESPRGNSTPSAPSGGGGNRPSPSVAAPAPRIGTPPPQNNNNGGVRPENRGRVEIGR